MSSGVILLPTLNRTRLLSRFLNSYKETEADSAGYILVDDLDYEKNSAEYEKIKAELLPPDWIFRLTKENVSMGDKVRFVWPEIKHFKWVGLLNDDHFCVTHKWDEKAEKLIDGTNMVSTNDGSWNFGVNVVGLSAWSMPLLEAVGFPIFPKGIDHWFIDNIWKSIGESTGAWVETMKINIEHRHLFIGKMELDETAKISQDQAKAQIAAKEFERFMREDFKGVCERVIKLRELNIKRAKFL